jgi:hypothetical protein
MSESSIKINPAKNSELEFDVIIQGMDDINIPIVKFVISSQADLCDYAFRCKRVDGEKNKWVAKLPALLHIKESSLKFHVEVIIDGYYFEPAQGDVLLVTDPTVKFQPSVSKPTVTTSFTVKQESVLEKEEDSGDLVEDMQEELTLPEHNSNSEHIANSVPTEAFVYDPKAVAESIVKHTLGSNSKPEHKGSLFKRDKSGKAVIKGLDTPAEKATKRSNAEKVKEILSS